MRPALPEILVPQKNTKISEKGNNARNAEYRQRSRALKDDRYIACALAAHAEAIVTSDRDLLVLGKPFGVPILSPVEFIKLVRAPGLT